MFEIKVLEENIFTKRYLIQQDTKRQKKTLKKTRKFMVDGVEVSVTTSKIVTDNDTKSEELRFLRYIRLHQLLFLVNVQQANDNVPDKSRLLFCRRQELRELRLLQKEEQRAQQQLSNKLQQQKEQLFRRFEQEMAVSTFIPSLDLFTFNIVIHCHPLFIVLSFVLTINTERTVLLHSDVE